MSCRSKYLVEPEEQPPEQPSTTTSTTGRHASVFQKLQSGFSLRPSLRRSHHHQDDNVSNSSISNTAAGGEGTAQGDIETG